MGFLNAFLGIEEQPQKDFDLILAQIKVWGLVTTVGDKEKLNEKLNEYLAFRQLSEVLSSVPDDQLEKIISYKGCEEHKELIEKIKFNCWEHEGIEKFLDLFENGKADKEDKQVIKLYQERDELGINSIRIM
tara:strand:- start:369 stop:764 length:396 start_codon:yes stop_codon:yes gene_type:complete